MIELWNILPLFLIFKTFNQYTKMASAWETEGLVLSSKKVQDASAWEAEGLVLTDVGSAERNCSIF